MQGYPPAMHVDLVALLCINRNALFVALMDGTVPIMVALRFKGLVKYSNDRVAARIISTVLGLFMIVYLFYKVDGVDLEYSYPHTMCDVLNVRKRGRLFYAREIKAITIDVHPLKTL